MVQMAHAKIIVAIYEPVFLDCMYGFRPGRGCHDALRALNWVIEKGCWMPTLTPTLAGYRIRGFWTA